MHTLSTQSNFGNSSLLQRIESLADFWWKLGRARGSMSQKLRAIRTGAWPRALHGVSSVIVGKKHWPPLRTQYMQALKVAKPGANPYLQMLLDGFCCDPQLYAIWTSLLDFRALGSNDSQLAMLDLIGRQAVDAAQASVSQVLCHRIHQLGWAIGSGGLVTDRFGQFSLGDCCVGELQTRVSRGWLDFVATQVSTRLDFKDFGQVDVPGTRKGLQCFPVVDQAALRAVMNGTTFTNRHAYHWSDDGSDLCPECGAVDSLRHKYWECPWVSALISTVPSDVLDVLPTLPEWARDRGWNVRPRILDLWSQYLLSLPTSAEVCPWVVELSSHECLDIFTDGSCVPGVTSVLSAASWSVLCWSTWKRWIVRGIVQGCLLWTFAWTFPICLPC